MTDLADPTPCDAIPLARPLAGGIPVARPISTAEIIGQATPDDELMLRQSSAGSMWIDVATLVVFVLAVEVAGGLLLSAFLDSAPAESLEGSSAGVAAQQPLLVPMLLLRTFGVFAAVALILRRRGQSIRSVGLVFSRFWLNLLLGIAACAAVYGMIIVVMPMIFLIFPDVMKQMEENAELLMGVVPRLHPLGFAVMAILIGVYEELVFRGFLMIRLRRATNSWVLGVLLSTAIFTALHALDQVPVALVWITLLSIVFSVVTIWRRSIVPAIVAHALFNFSQLILMSWQAGESWT